MLFQTMSQLGDTIKGIVDISDGAVKVLNAQRVRGALIDRLAATAACHEKVEMRAITRWLVKMMAPALNIYGKTALPLETSIHIPVPVVQVTGKIYLSGRALFKAAAQHQVGALTFPDPVSGYSSQYHAILTAAAIAENYSGFLFFQNRAAENTSSIVTLDTLFKKSQHNNTPSLEFNEKLLESGLKIQTVIFSTDLVSSEKESAFSWPLPLDLSEKFFNGIGETLEIYFRKSGILNTKEQVQKQLKPVEVSFTLRDEITAAMAESPAKKDHPIFESFKGLNTIH